MMLPVLLSAILYASSPISPPSEQLPYASTDLVFQSTDTVKNACTALEASTDADLRRFVQQSQKGNHQEAYRIWENMLFRYFSFRLDLWQTLQHSLSNEVKESVGMRVARLEGDFQKKLLSHPHLLNAFLENANAAVDLTPQQRLWTLNILKEYAETSPEENSSITKGIEQLSDKYLESFARSEGIADPVNGRQLLNLKVLTANIICFPEKLPYFFGGICPWKDRIDRLVETLLTAEAHVICLQEVWDPEAMHALVERLKNHYAFFIYDAGAPMGTLQVNQMGYGSGLFIASKVPLDSVTFKRFPRSIPKESNRGALIITASIADKHFSLVNTHLQHGTTLEMQQVRQEQLLLCYATLQEMISRNPLARSWGCLTGDINIDGFIPEFKQSGLARLFSIPSPGPQSKHKATATNYFTDLVETSPDLRSSVAISYELLDYCTTPNLSPITLSSEQMLIPLFDVAAPTQALSDHHALLTTWAVAESKK